MPLFLVLKAALSDNVASVSIENTIELRAEFTFDLQCTSCRELHDSKIMINTFEEHPMPSSKGTASFLMKCKFCSKEISVNLSIFENEYLTDRNNEARAKIKDIRKKHGLSKIEEDSFIPLNLDCRGCELIKFYPDNLSFQVSLNSGKEMVCQLEDNEWYDYDDDSGEEVTMTEFSSEFIKGK
ncbi:YCR090C [Saccharomyces arboricola H-6]|uniref:YCR090C n=1 Tax=Saccharomyces arboricola (strain H-6 / AS 2.3317 / CBS 10644) TaxID=1160507 RepID=J8Q456_SACAR|nr:YCR090C [Saccharomyces arboricola H-6]